MACVAVTAVHDSARLVFGGLTCLWYIWPTKHKPFIIELTAVWYIYVFIVIQLIIQQKYQTEIETEGQAWKKSIVESNLLLEEQFRLQEGKKRRTSYTKKRISPFIFLASSTIECDRMGRFNGKRTYHFFLLAVKRIELYFCLKKHKNTHRFMMIWYFLLKKNVSSLPQGGFMKNYSLQITNENCILMLVFAVLYTICTSISEKDKGEREIYFKKNWKN